MDTISVVIVSYNTKALTLRAVEGVYRDASDSHPKIPVEVIVVDNGSTDGSVEAVHKRFPQAVLVQNKENLGFSAANNIGAARAKGKYLLFLNSDAELQPGALLGLVEVFQKDGKVGAVSGQLRNPDDSIQPQGGALPTLWNVALWMLFLDDLPLVNMFLLPYQQRSQAYFLRSRQTGWVGGTALMTEAEFFRKLGGWDENMFLYGEDIELCLRIYKAGKTVCLASDAVITHTKHASGGSGRALAGEAQGLLYIWRKHKLAWSLPILKFFLALGAWLRILIFGILLGDEEKQRAYREILRILSLA